MQQLRRVLQRGGLATIAELSARRPQPVVRGREVLFLFEENGRKAREVRLVHCVSSLDRAPKLERVDDDGPFALHLVLPPEARMEYTFGISWADGGQEIRTDPHNDREAWCPLGPKSVVTTEQYVLPRWAEASDEVAKGTVESFTLASRELGDERTFKVYTPATEPPAEGFPLLLVHDGNDYEQYSDLVRVLDNCIADGLCEPLVAVLTKPIERNQEYSCTPEHPDFLVHELLPWVEARYPVSRDRERTGMMGASFGAVASVYGAHRHPERIGRLLIQSGSFYYWNVVHTPSLFEPFDEWDRIGLFLEGEFFPDGFAQPMRIFHSCGTFEAILTRNRAFADSLRELGHDVCYRESHDGHNWVSWRDHFGEGLTHLFPPRSESQPTD